MDLDGIFNRILPILTGRAKYALEHAAKLAQQMNHDAVEPYHLLHIFLKQTGSMATNCLKKNNENSLEDKLLEILHALPSSALCQEGKPPYSDKFKRIVCFAEEEAKRMGCMYVGTEHLLLALFKDTSGCGELLEAAGYRYGGLWADIAEPFLKKLFEDNDSKKNDGDSSDNSSQKEPDEANDQNNSTHLRDILEVISLNPGNNSDNSEPEDDEDNEDDDNDAEDDDEEDNDDDDMNNAPNFPIGEDGPREHVSLKSFGRDITELAAQGKLDPVIGRKKEMTRMIQVLCRRNKNNPVLIGEAGVGKTAIVEGIAHAIVQKKVPEFLQKKKIIELDLTLIVAGTKYRGQFEERIKAIINEVKSSPNIILFIDEIHTLVGAGSAEGSFDAANILKPSLARGEFQCIGATTMDEYRKSIEKDAALERRFQAIKVDPPTIDETIQILEGLHENYEKHHGVKYTKEALIAAAKLSDRYITARHLPDKAIDLLDEAGSYVRIHHIPKAAPDQSELQAQIDKLEKEKNTAVEATEYEKAHEINCRQIKIQEKMQKRLEKHAAYLQKHMPIVDVEEINHILGELTGVPLEQIQNSETKKLLHIEDNLAEKVIGQQDAIQSLAKALRRSRVKLNDPNRPIGSFIFLGPTGVGKTLLAKTLANFMFGTQDSIVQFDMSEFMEKFNVSRLVGSPPGYVGHGEGGELTERIRRNPYSLVLFDEIEKAHPDIMHLLLQILEEGKLTDSLGRKIDFRNTVVIMTSNIGAERFANHAPLGFATSETNSNENYESLRGMLLDAARKTLKPEFLNRIDELIVFHSLNKDFVQQITKLEINKLVSRLAEQNRTLKYNDSVVEHIVDKGYSSEYGVRPIRRLISSLLEDPLADKILSGEFPEDETLLVNCKENELTFSLSPSKKKKT